MWFLVIAFVIDEYAESIKMWTYPNPEDADSFHFRLPVCQARGTAAPAAVPTYSKTKHKHSFLSHFVLNSHTYIFDWYKVKASLKVKGEECIC